MQERFCAGLAFTAAYWSELETAEPDDEDDPPPPIEPRCTRPLYRARSRPARRSLPPSRLR